MFGILCISRHPKHGGTASHGTLEFCVPYHRAAGRIILLNILPLLLILRLDTRHTPLLPFQITLPFRGSNCLHDPILAVPPLLLAHRHRLE